MDKKKPKIEYRYYDIPSESSVLALLGENWIRNYGENKPIEYLHFHNHIEIGFCHWGKGILELNDENFLFDDKMFSLIPKNFPHTTNSYGYGLCFWEYLYIDVDKFLSNVYWDNPTKANEIIRTINMKAHFYHAKDQPEIAMQIQQILEIMRNKKELYIDEVNGIILALLIQIARLNKTDEFHKEPPKENSMVIAPALAFVSHNFDNHIKAEELAEICHISETHFRRIFKKYIGKTPGEYINWVRINAACDLLKRTDDSINAIALKVGFSTVTSFNRNFRLLMNTSPRKWKRKPEHYEQTLLNYDVKKHRGW